MDIHILDDTPMKILLEDVRYYRDAFDIKGIVILSGYAFDGLSIPRLMQWLVNMNESQNIKAGLIHDHDFSKLSDSKFWESNFRLYNNLKASRPARVVAFIGVTLFGLFSYKKDTNYKKYRQQIEDYRLSLISKK